MAEAIEEKLADKRIAFLVANEGAEQIELTRPWEAVEEAGGKPELIAPDGGEARAFKHLDRGDAFRVDHRINDVQEADYDALILPGGVANPDFLRQDESAVAFARAFFESGKPVAAICHAPWLLVEAGVVDGRTLTSFPSLQTDIENAGGNWVDQEVCVDAGLVTSRRPDDLDAFCAKAVEEISEGIHAEQRAQALSS